MAEKTFQLDDIDPVRIFGVNNKNLDLFKKAFPKLKVVARGSSIKLIGDKKTIDRFGEKLDLIRKYLHKYNTVDESTLKGLMETDGEALLEGEKDNEEDDVLVYGEGGSRIRARSVNQGKLVDSCQQNDMVFAIGPAGTGKTYTAVALAVKALKEKQVTRIILTRPAVEAGENLGFLPGDIKEKLDPYLRPLSDALHDMIPPEKLQFYKESGVIEIAPLGFMRGRTLDHAFVILDEAQNATKGQMKMFLTRMGKSAKFVITGDVTQVDLPRSQPSGLIKAMNALKDVEGIGCVELDGRDVVRHPLVNKILEAFEQADDDDE